MVLAKIKKRRIADSPTKSINLHWDTTSFSRIVKVVLDVRQENGKHYWCWKPKDIIATSHAYMKVTNTTFTGKHTLELLNNMKSVRRRDLNRGENMCEKQNGYDQQNIFTYFTLPLDNVTFENTGHEVDYIHTQLTYSAGEIKTFFGSNLFSAALHNTVEAYSVGLSDAMFNKPKGQSYQQFMRAASPVVKHAGPMTNHIVKDNVMELNRRLAGFDLDMPKYEDDGSGLTYHDISSAATDDDEPQTAELEDDSDVEEVEVKDVGEEDEEVEDEEEEEVEVEDVTDEDEDEE
jgi:hypothetical protein